MIYTGVLYGNYEGFIIFFFGNFLTCLVIFSLQTGGNLYFLGKIGESSTVEIEYCNTLVAFSGFPRI